MELREVGKVAHWPALLDGEHVLNHEYYYYDSDGVLVNVQGDSWEDMVEKYNNWPAGQATIYRTPNGRHIVVEDCIFHSEHIFDALPDVRVVHIRYADGSDRTITREQVEEYRRVMRAAMERATTWAVSPLQALTGRYH